MEGNKYRKYLHQSLAGFGSLAMAILFYFVIEKLREILSAVHFAVEILKPFLYGGALAFVLTPMCGWLEDRLNHGFRTWLGEKRGAKAANTISVVLVLGMLAAVVYALAAMILPQLFSSLQRLLESLPAMLESGRRWSQDLISRHPILEGLAGGLPEQLAASLPGWLSAVLLPSMESMAEGFTNGVSSVVTLIKNLAVGVASGIYFLSGRRLFAAQAKKLLYCLLSRERAETVLEVCFETNRIFSGFIGAKLLDSLIIGILCFIGTAALGIPYATLIAVMVGATNVIPFFGPFIGGAPSALLVLSISPVKGLYFLLFLLVLQQFDSNILEPKIVGGSTGLSGFWVMFALMVFGGLFGFVGMLLGIPVFAVLYHFLSRAIRRRLEQKGLSPESSSYVE